MDTRTAIVTGRASSGIGLALAAGPIRRDTGAVTLIFTSDREASQVGLGVIGEKIRALAQYNAELAIEPQSKIEAKPR